jgi:hypothetical protein
MSIIGRHRAPTDSAARSVVGVGEQVTPHMSPICGLMAMDAS